MKRAATLFIGISVLLTSCQRGSPDCSMLLQNGNARVVSINTVTISNWLCLHDDGTDFTYSSTVTWSAITQDMRDRGLMMVYIRNNTTQAWQTLPCSYAADGYSEAFSFDVNTGLVKITCDGYDLSSGSPGVSSLNGLLTVRLVAVDTSARNANHPKVYIKSGDGSALLKKPG